MKGSYRKGALIRRTGFRITTLRNCLNKPRITIAFFCCPHWCRHTVNLDTRFVVRGSQHRSHVSTAVLQHCTAAMAFFLRTNSDASSLGRFPRAILLGVWPLLSRRDKGGPARGYSVFTKLNHLKRGFCCGNGCRSGGNPSSQLHARCFTKHRKSSRKCKIIKYLSFGFFGSAEKC